MMLRFTDASLFVCVFVVFYSQLFYFLGSGTMAKPYDDSVESSSCSDSEIPKSTETSQSKKRSRESSEERHTLCELSDDGRPKTRRVNPQKLAIRLGPELVAEMEALIIPGAKMPNFTVRKDFQERYNVDRRHIYDYFHSRGKIYALQMRYRTIINRFKGLRVAKEDKHTNLIRGRAARALQESSKSKVGLYPGLMSVV